MAPLEVSDHYSTFEHIFEGKKMMRFSKLISVLFFCWSCCSTLTSVNIIAQSPHTNYILCYPMCPNCQLSFACQHFMFNDCLVQTSAFPDWCMVVSIHNSMQPYKFGTSRVTCTFTPTNKSTPGNICFGNVWAINFKAISSLVLLSLR